MLITSLITKIKDAITPKRDKPIVHQGIVLGYLASKYVPNQVKKAIIPAI